ncbi:MAG: DUF4126 domain-containing protein [Pyrinomonadaceae bacterium]|jgi:hypothetical protein
MEALSTISIALGSAWTSGINLYATVAVLGLLQKFGATRLPGGLEALDNWLIIGAAVFLYLIEFFADKFPYVDSVWDVVHTFIRVPAGAIVAYAAVSDLDPSISVTAALLGGGIAFSSHGSKAAARIGANLSPEPISNWVLSLAEDAIAIFGTIAAVFAPILLLAILVVFLLFFVWFSRRIFRAIRRLLVAAAAFIRGESFAEVARKAG